MLRATPGCRWMNPARSRAAKDDPRLPLLEKQQEDLYREAVQRSGRAWKAIAGKAIKRPKVSKNDSSSSSAPFMPTSEEWTRTHSSLMKAHASPGSQRTGIPSQSPNFGSILTIWGSGRQNEPRPARQGDGWAKAEGAQAKRASKQNRKFSRAAPRDRPGRRAYMAALSACHFNLQLSAFPRPPHGRWQASHARYRDLCIVARAERKVRGQGSGRHWDGAVWKAPMIRVPVLTGQAFPKSHARAPRDLYRRFLGLLNLAERDRGIPVS